MKFPFSLKINLHIWIAVLFNSFIYNAYAQEKDVEALLKLKIEQLFNVEIISASKTLKKINEVPATVKVITSETIQNNGYSTLEETLADIPGFQFRNIVGFNSYVFQRGVPNQNNLILLLIDGVQVNELNSGGFYGGAQFNLDNVDQIEVVYGPASALYGTNAISGIINIIMKDPSKSKGLEASILYGSFKTVNSNLSYGYFNKNKDFGFRIAGMFKTSEKAELKVDDGDFNWTRNLENFEDDYSVDLKVNYQKFRYGLNFQKKMASRSTNYKSSNTHYLDSGTSWNIQFLNTYLKHNHSFNENLNVSSMLYYRNTTVLDNTIAYITETEQVGYYRPNDLLGIESIINYNPFKSIELIGGIVYENENLANGFSKSYSNSSTEIPPAPKEPKEENNRLLSIYIQGQQKLNKFLELTAGVRYDNSSVYNDVFTPRAGIVYNNNNFFMKLLYTEAFRAPKPWDYTSGLGNPELNPEEIKSLEFSIGNTFFSKLHINAVYYHNILDQIFTQINFQNGWRWENAGKTTVDGFEFSAELKSEKYNIYANYTYNYSEDDNKVILPEISKHSANAGIYYSPTKKIKINLRMNYLGERKNPKLISTTGSQYINSAIIFHSTISYLKFKNFNFRFIIKNLFNEKYYHTSNRPPDRYRQPQRTILFKIEYVLN